MKECLSKVRKNGPELLDHYYGCIAFGSAGLYFSGSMTG